jgi:hypothetical protein
MIQREELACKVKDSIHDATSKWRHMKRLHAWFLILSFVTSAAATLLAGSTSFLEAPVIKFFKVEENKKEEGYKKEEEYKKKEEYDKKNWTLICGIAAILTFSSSICVGINQVLGDAKRVDDVRSCVGRLKALVILINGDKLSVNDILEDYAKIIEDYPELTVQKEKKGNRGNRKKRWQGKI